jgi:hypothetical protein
MHSGFKCLVADLQDKASREISILVDCHRFAAICCDGVQAFPSRKSMLGFIIKAKSRTWRFRTTCKFGKNDETCLDHP